MVHFCTIGAAMSLFPHRESHRLCVYYWLVGNGRLSEAIEKLGAERPPKVQINWFDYFAFNVAQSRKIYLFGKSRSICGIGHVIELSEAPYWGYISCLSITWECVSLLGGIALHTHKIRIQMGVDGNGRFGDLMVNECFQRIIIN